MRYLNVGALASDHPDNRALQVLMVRGPDMPGNSSRLCDFGPRNRHTTLLNAPIWEAAPGGQLGLKLNGTNQRGTCTNPSGAAGLTVAMWWKTTTASGNVVAVGWSNKIWIGASSGRVTFYPAGSGQAQEATASSNDGKWHRIVAIHLAGTSKVFVDGIEKNSAAGTLHTTPITTMEVGAFGGWFLFPGSLAGIRVHAVGFSADWAARDWKYSQNLETDPRLSQFARQSYTAGGGGGSSSMLGLLGVG